MKRIIEVSTPGLHVATRLHQVVITASGEQRGSVPLEDLGCLLLGERCTVTGAALAACADNACVVIVVGSDHTPAGVLLPTRGHSTRGERTRAQVGSSIPLRKNLWARLVRAKLMNQGAMLEDGVARRRLEHLAAKVKSGDSGQCEAQGARIYWPAVFVGHYGAFESGPFRRRRDGEWPNNLLNYGYAVLRAMVARALCAAGLLVEVGVHHHNRYDPMALASDAMEPYRPWVDHRCRELLAEGPRELDRPAREALLSIYDDPTSLGGEQTPLAVAVERGAAGLAQAFLAQAGGEAAARAASLLVLPTFIR